MRFGWDLEPEEYYLYVPDGADEAIGVLELEMPTRDNRHLVWAGLTVHPDHRRRGHGRLIMDEVRCRTAQAGRDTIWLGAAEDDQGVRTSSRAAASTTPVTTPAVGSCSPLLIMTR